jgi:AbrB family looped-hinge helix DNA binding protein
MTSRVGPKGQVVIPKVLRDRLAIHPGDEVVFDFDGTSLRVEKVERRETLRGALAGLALTERLEAEHRRELEREDERTR